MKSSHSYLLAGTALLLVGSVPAAALAAKVAVLPTQFAKSAKGKVPSIFDDYLLSAVQNIGGFEVIGQDDINAMLSFEKQKDIFGCNDASCFAEIGGALGVDEIVALKVARVGDEWALSAKLIDIKSPAVKARSTDFIKGEAGALLKSIPAIIRKLFRGGGIATTPVAPTTPSQSATAAPAHSAASGSEAGLARAVHGAWTAPTPEQKKTITTLLEASAKDWVSMNNVGASASSFKIAAKHCESSGQPNACLDAGVMAQLGHGTRQSLEQAGAYYARSCALSNDRGCVAAEGLVARIGPKSPNAARALGLLCAGNVQQACKLLAEGGRRDRGVGAIADACIDSKVAPACYQLNRMGEISRAGHTRRVVGYVFGGLGLAATAGGSIWLAGAGPSGSSVGVAAGITLVGVAAVVVGIVQLVKGIKEEHRAESLGDSYQPLTAAPPETTLVPALLPTRPEQPPAPGMMLSLSY